MSGYDIHSLFQNEKLMTMFLSLMAFPIIASNENLIVIKNVNVLLGNTYDGQRLIRNELRYRITHECFLFRLAIVILRLRIIVFIYIVIFKIKQT